jgi:hypothetical protein
MIVLDFNILQYWFFCNHSAIVNSSQVTRLWHDFHRSVIVGDEA